MNSKISLLCSIPHPQDATSLYRGIGPLQSLRRMSGFNLDLSFNTEINWMQLKSCDAVFFQRPAVDAHLGAFRFCKTNKKRIWIDYDDNLHAIPMCNRRFPTYGDPRIQHNIASMVAMADVVTVSTQHLAESMAKLLRVFPPTPEYRLDPRKLVVIPNAYDEELHPELKRPERKRLVVWRGSDSHCKDLMTHTSELVSVIKDHQDWSYEFIGEPFWWTMEQLKAAVKPGVLSITLAMDPTHFFRHLERQRPALVIVPLEDQGFNRSKSNIAWIEATAAGAVTLAPAWEEWSKPGVITYENLADFEAKFRKFLTGGFDDQMLWQASADYIQRELSLKSVNLRRFNVLEELIGLG